MSPFLRGSTKYLEEIFWTNHSLRQHWKQEPWKILTSYPHKQSRLGIKPPPYFPSVSKEGKGPLFNSYPSSDLKWIVTPGREKISSYYVVKSYTESLCWKTLAKEICCYSYYLNINNISSVFFCNYCFSSSIITIETSLNIKVGVYYLLAKGNQRERKVPNYKCGMTKNAVWKP